MAQKDQAKENRKINSQSDRTKYEQGLAAACRSWTSTSNCYATQSCPVLAKRSLNPFGVGKFQSLLDYFAKMTTHVAEDDQRTRINMQASHKNDVMKCVFNWYLTTYTEPRDVKLMQYNIQDNV